MPYIGLFFNAKPTCIPALNLIWLWYISHFKYCYLNLLTFRLEFLIYVCKVYCTVVFLSCHVFGFVIRVMLATQNELESIFSSLIFWKSFRWYYRSFKCLLKFSTEIVWSCCLFVGGFLVISLIYLRDIGLFRWSVSFQVSFGSLCFKECLFHLNYQIYLQKTVHNISLFLLIFLKSVVMLFLSFLMLVICIFSLFFLSA